MTNGNKKSLLQHQKIEQGKDDVIIKVKRLPISNQQDKTESDVQSDKETPRRNGPVSTPWRYGRSYMKTNNDQDLNVG